MSEEQARSRIGFEALPGPFPLDPPPFPSSWDPIPLPNPTPPSHLAADAPATPSQPAGLSPGDIAVLRTRLPNLAGFSDDTFRFTPLTTTRAQRKLQ
jgi:hypothetical protein